MSKYQRIDDVGCTATGGPTNYMSFLGDEGVQLNKFQLGNFTKMVGSVSHCWIVSPSKVM